MYKTVWDLPQKCLVDLAVDRAPFVDQSQSMNIFMATPDFRRITSSHIYTWRKGLKTGIYYLRSKPASEPTQFTLDSSFIQEQQKQQKQQDQRDQRDQPKHQKDTEPCDMCSA